MSSEYKLSKYIYVIDNKEYIAVYSYINSKIAFCTVKEEIEFFRIFLNGGDYYETDFTQKLKKLDIIIDKNYDEDKLLDFLFKKSLSQSDTLFIIMIPSQLCNFNCLYCYEDKEPHVMSEEILAGTVNFIQKMVRGNSLKKVQIEWFGGEPTLFEDLILNFLYTLKITLPDIAIVSSMTTNGYLLDLDRFNKFLDNNITSYQITLDGFAETHDRLRVLKNKKGTWDVVYNNLIKMKSVEKKFNITIRVNYNESMFDKIFDFMLFIKENFDSRFKIHLHPISNFDKTKKFTHEMCDSTISEFAKFAMFEFIAENEIMSDIPLLYTSFASTICYAAKPYSFVIDEKGVIRKCTIALDEDCNDVGKIIDKDNFYLNLFKLAEWTESAHRNNNCKKCSSFPTCNGTQGCPLTLVRKNDSPCRIDPRISETYIRKIVERTYQKNFAAK